MASHAWSPRLHGCTRQPASFYRFPTDWQNCLSNSGGFLSSTTTACYSCRWVRRSTWRCVRVVDRRAFLVFVIVFVQCGPDSVVRWRARVEGTRFSKKDKQPSNRSPSRKQDIGLLGAGKLCFGRDARGQIAYRVSQGIHRRPPFWAGLERRSRVVIDQHQIAVARRVLRSRRTQIALAASQFRFGSERFDDWHFILLANQRIQALSFLVFVGCLVGAVHAFIAHDNRRHWTDGCLGGRHRARHAIRVGNGKELGLLEADLAAILVDRLTIVCARVVRGYGFEDLLYGLVLRALLASRL